MQGLPSILPLFRNEINKFNKPRARMLDSINHMTLKSSVKWRFGCEKGKILPYIRDHYIM